MKAFVGGITVLAQRPISRAPIRLLLAGFCLGCALVTCAALPAVLMMSDTAQARDRGRNRGEDFDNDSFNSDRGNGRRERENRDFEREQRMERREQRIEQRDTNRDFNEDRKSTDNAQSRQQLDSGSNSTGKTRDSTEQQQTGRSDQSSRNDNSRRNSEKDGETSSRREDEDQAEEPSQPPPATVVEFLKRMLSPETEAAQSSEKQKDKNKKSEEEKKADEAVKKEQPQNTAEKKKTDEKAAEKDGAKDEPEEKRKKKEWTAEDYPSFNPRKLPRPGVLAVNPNDKALERAQARGFKVETIGSDSRHKQSLTRFTPPPDMSLLEAEQFLRTSTPGMKLGVNQKYSLYHTATGSPEPDPPAPQSGRPGPPCDSDHCFGREIMGWHHELQACAKSIPVGVIDTGVDTQHPAFKNKKIDVNYLALDPNARGENWHGTGVMALLAGDADSGTPGLIPEAQFYVADIFFKDSDGQPTSDTASFIQALDWLEQKHVKIVNMSLAGPPDNLVREAIERMSAAGVLFVAAAGNQGPNAPPSYPAAYEPVIAVTAVSKNLTGYRYANQGDYIDVAAPGVSVWTALPGGMNGYRSGTSFAVPYVTSVIAAVQAHLTAKTKPGVLANLNILDIGTPGKDEIFGRGLLLAPDHCQPGPTARGPRKPASAGLTMQQGAATAEVLPWFDPARK